MQSSRRSYRFALAALVLLAAQRARGQTALDDIVKRKIIRIVPGWPAR